PGPDPSADGTVVRKFPPRAAGMVVGVASECDTLVVELQRLENSGELPGRDLVALLDELGVSGKQVHQMADRLNLVISRENLHQEAALRTALHRRFGPAIRIDDVAQASVVGAGINRSFENVRCGSAALDATGIRIR